MSDESKKFRELILKDGRYTLEAYQFVREALAYAHEVLKLGGEETTEPADEEAGGEKRRERHLTGQQLSEAIRLYALEQYGLMAKVVLNSWGLYTTGDFGEIVYNLIGIGWMKKSARDRREDFDNVYDFDEAFEQDFKITMRGGYV